MNVWQDRILDAIDKSLAITSNGQPIPLGNEQGIDVVGDMVEGHYSNNIFRYTAYCATDFNFYS